MQQKPLNKIENEFTYMTIFLKTNQLKKQQSILPSNLEFKI